LIAVVAANSIVAAVVAASSGLVAAEVVLEVFEQAIARHKQDMSLEFAIAKLARQVSLSRWFSLVQL
jgi:hypothetical protein